jgi:hypothetical protein
MIAAFMAFLKFWYVPGLTGCLVLLISNKFKGFDLVGFFGLALLGWLMLGGTLLCLVGRVRSSVERIKEYFSDYVGRIMKALS